MILKRIVQKRTMKAIQHKGEYTIQALSEHENITTEKCEK